MHIIAIFNIKTFFLKKNSFFRNDLIFSKSHYFENCNNNNTIRFWHKKLHKVDSKRSPWEEKNKKKGFLEVNHIKFSL